MLDLIGEVSGVAGITQVNNSKPKQEEGGSQELKAKTIRVHNLGFSCVDAYAIPLERIKRGHLRHTYRLFENLLPSHPDEENTVIYVLKRDNPIGNWVYDALWTCAHFEHTEMTAMSRILTIVEEFQFDVEGVESHVQLLDGHREKLVIETYDINHKIARWLISKGTPVEAEPKTVKGADGE